MIESASSKNLPDANIATATVDTYRIPGQPLFVIGTLDTGVTVLSQQVRALNLVWGLVSSGAVGTVAEDPTLKIAIVGGGFAGLSVAAGLVRKGANAAISLFERRDTLLPLQQGSDSRWLHPHIYDWPMLGSESFSAALPVLNWTASRASDVVVQVLRGWEKLIADNLELIADDSSRQLRVFCNTRHLQVAGTSLASGRAQIEWVGERRDPAHPANPLANASVPNGLSEDFDLVILAVGFGLEKGRQPSYWRNETLAQPQLGLAMATYIVSGAGDAAMIDLFRLRISEFRQDRILAELFNGRTELLSRLREIDLESREDSVNLYQRFRDLWEDETLRAETHAVRAKLENRLRHDTQVVLHVRSARFEDIFDSGRVSFQNRLLGFLLFRAGGFHPSTEDIDHLAEEYFVPADRIIRRHGTRERKALRAVLAKDLRQAVKVAFEDATPLHQIDDLRWTGGYFDYTGPVPPEAAASAIRARWRKEHLPSPTQAIATVFCAAVAGFLEVTHPTNSRLRVTFHRALRIGAEEVLQQCCEYAGTGLSADEPGGAAGRTFPANHATIGAAYVQRKIFRTRAGAEPDAINSDMQLLHLKDSSRQMSEKVHSVVAIPVTRNADTSQLYESPTRNVIGVLYLDSEEQDYFIDEARMTTLISMTQEFANSLSHLDVTADGRLANNAFWRGSTPIGASSLAADPGTLASFEVVAVDPPTVQHPAQVNFDFSDFERVEN